jgi:predicted Fe-S protein YdhL (DUF1289 family)
MIKSPCIRNCCLDENNICLGCFRSLQEICDWSNSSDDEKKEVLKKCQQRQTERHQQMNQNKDLK